MSHYISCKWTILCLLFMAHTTADGFSLSTPGSSNVRIIQVTTPREWLCVADVRYDEFVKTDVRYEEWIKSDDEHSTRPSRDAFRYATIDIYAEERPDAMLFLATKKNGRVVGSAELSPMELENGSLWITDCSSDDDVKVMYVTDVVTDRDHRRQGIAATLMKEMESHAIQHHGVKYLVLHVVPDNVAAQRFYETLGYSEVLPFELSLILNVERLAENAGTKGQLLLSKKIATS
jgi:ribosomal protein S18 acetylase RimI-like enzyme